MSIVETSHKHNDGFCRVVAVRAPTIERAAYHTTAHILVRLFELNSPVEPVVPSGCSLRLTYKSYIIVAFTQ
jgi:hypothetical protein